MTNPQTHIPGDRLGGARLVVRPDRGLIRASGRSRPFLLIDVTAPTVRPDPTRRRTPVNLAFVLDRSGSMGGHNKLSLAKQAESQRDMEVKKAAYLEAVKKQQAQADKAYDIQSNVMQQQVIAELTALGLPGLEVARPGAVYTF